MNFKEKLTALKIKIDRDFGIMDEWATSHATIILSIENGMLSALTNPVVDGLLATLLPAPVVAMQPKIEEMLATAIKDTMAGSYVLDNINAQSTTEGKVKAFLGDIATMPSMAPAFIRTVCERLLTLVTNGAMQPDMAKLYLQLEAIKAKL